MQNSFKLIQHEHNNKGYGKFTKGIITTSASILLGFLFGIGTSVILARVLGPKGKGIYTLATLLPSLIVTFGNLGIGPAAAYYVAKGEFRRQEILGNNIILSFVIGSIGMLFGLAIVLFLKEIVFPGIPAAYLLLALLLVPFEIFASYVNYILLGARHIKEFNYVQIIQSALFLTFSTCALVGLRAGVTGAILAGLFTWLAVDFFVLRCATQISGGIKLEPSLSYMKHATAYGIQVHLMNVLGFLNYRVDMFLTNWFLGSSAVGIYSIGVGLVEKLWIISQAASIVLFPKVAAETLEERRNEFTPLVARTVLLITALGALVLAILSRSIIFLLYTKAFLPAVEAIRALLPGIVTLSVGRVLSNDIAGRGFPRLNIYTGLAAVLTNIVLNILWIPRYGIAGAAWASTVSYTVSFLGALLFYCRLSGNQWQKVILPQRGDCTIYISLINVLIGRK
jgi:O-antigen/teichoic acid export membrane protein